MAKDTTNSGAGALAHGGLRTEDAALLTGSALFLDDLPEPKRVVHAAILRSPHAHADIEAIDVEAAARIPGVTAVYTGADIAAVTRPLMAGVKLPIECWPIALDRVRYVGEPVAVVLAKDRYVAEDAADLIKVTYSRRDPVLDPVVAAGPSDPLHPKMDGNLAAERSFHYGDVPAAMKAATAQVSLEVSYPRNSCTPIETYGVLASYDANEDAYDVSANFQGPFSIHPVIARALGVPGNRLRLRTPENSGGSFGIKQGVFPYIVLLSAAARLAGVPVKWVEDRLEHLTASVSATNRVIKLTAAVEADGRVTALDLDQIEDVGAYLRAPEPATLYRMHGNLCGAYEIRNLRVRNRIVMTNKTPTGLNRGFGGPQLYFALERLMQRISLELGLDHQEVIRRNLIGADAFPYRTASGATYDSGNYQQALDIAMREGGYDELCARRDAARAEGRLYGIGLAAVVEPSVSNMGYLSVALTPEDRAKAGPKGGAQAVATISIDPVGSVTVQIDSVPQGQGHRTVAADVAAQVLGLPADAIRVIASMDTAKDGWSIAAGNYSSRFAAASASAVKLAAERIRAKLAAAASAQLGVGAEQIAFSDGKVFAEGHPESGIAFSRLSAAGHWTASEGQVLRETAIWSPPELAPPTNEDGINSSLCHAFIFDFCGVEIDPVTSKVRVDRYVTMHDCGAILHEGMVEGQIRGAFAHAIGASLLEEYAYAEDGAFLAGTFADYPVPTAHEVPDLQILHISTPSPVTPTGAKGVGEGNCMSTPACLANAVADALSGGHRFIDLTLPLSEARVSAFLGEEPQAPAGAVASRPATGRGLTGRGSAKVAASPQAVWDLLMDADALVSIIPGAHSVTKPSPTEFNADVTLGVGPVKGRYEIGVSLSDLVPPKSAVLSGRAAGALGTGEGRGTVMLTPLPDGGTEISYEYEAQVGGKVASVGGRLLDGAAKIVIGQFFGALGRKASGAEESGWLARIKSLIGGKS